MISFDRKAFAKGVHDVLTLAPLRRLFRPSLVRPDVVRSGPTQALKDAYALYRENIERRSAVSDDELIEVMARASRAANKDEPRPDSEEVARAALSALRKAGYEVRRAIPSPTPSETLP